MVLLDLVVIGAFLIIIGLILGKFAFSASKGNVIQQVGFRAPRRYVNLEKKTVGRVAGSLGITQVDAEHVNIRYTTGFFATEIDEDVPISAIKNIDPPETRKHPEGILLVLPYTRKNTLNDITDVYRIEINKLRELAVSLQTHITELTTELSAGKSSSIALQNLKRLASLVEEIKRSAEGTVDRVQDIPITKPDRKTIELRPPPRVQ